MPPKRKDAPDTPPPAAKLAQKRKRLTQTRSQLNFDIPSVKHRIGVLEDRLAGQRRLWRNLTGLDYPQAIRQRNYKHYGFTYSDALRLSQHKQYLSDRIRQLGSIKDQLQYLDDQKVMLKQYEHHAV